jgi:hypothetical protein
MGFASSTASLFAFPIAVCLLITELFDCETRDENKMKTMMGEKEENFFPFFFSPLPG